MQVIIQSMVDFLWQLPCNVIKEVRGFFYTVYLVQHPSRQISVATLASRLRLFMSGHLQSRVCLLSTAAGTLGDPCRWHPISSPAPTPYAAVTALWVAPWHENVAAEVTT